MNRYVHGREREKNRERNDRKGIKKIQGRVFNTRNGKNVSKYKLIPTVQSL